MKIIITILAVVFLANCSAKDTEKNTDIGNDVSNDVGRDIIQKDVADLVSLGAPQITRITPEKCDNSRPHQIFDAAAFIGCDSDDECTDGDNGRCVSRIRLDESSRICTYDECYQDDDCDQGTTCSCGKDSHSDFAFYTRADENKCVDANCKTDDDCGAQFCKPNLGACPETGDRVDGYFCTTENDECRNDSDCGAYSCVFTPEVDKWICALACS